MVWTCAVVGELKNGPNITHVSCHMHNGPLNGLIEGFDVSRGGSGKFVAKSTGNEGIE